MYRHRKQSRMYIILLTRIVSEEQKYLWYFDFLKKIIRDIYTLMLPSLTKKRKMNCHSFVLQIFFLF